MNLFKRTLAVLLVISTIFASACITGSGPDASLIEAMEQDGRFTQFLGLMETTGLDEMFSGEGQFTIFAPTDEAFESLDSDFASLLDNDPGLLADVLSYHVASASLSKADVSKSGEVVTLQGEAISVTTAGEVQLNGAALGDETECTDGWLFSLDSVILPPTVERSFIDLTFEDGIGKSIYLAEVPTRIVSLASSATEIIFSIGAGDSIVGRDKYSTLPAEVESITNVGSSYSLAVDKVVELDPDLVIAWYYATAAIQTLEDLGFTVMAINPTSIQDVVDLISLFGEITGNESSAQDVSGMIQTIMDDLESYTSTLSEDDKVKVYYELSTVYKSPNNSTITGEMITLAGGINIAGEQEDTYTVLSSEWIIQQNPDIIVVVSYGAGIDEIKAREGWDSISAVQNDNVYAIDTNWATSNTLLWKGLEQFSKWFYPEHYE